MGKARINLIPKYKPLFNTDKRYILITGGRGSAKSFHVADFLLKLTYEEGHVILFTRYTMVSASISIIPEFQDKIDRYQLNHVFNVKRNEIENKLTGSKILFRGIQTSRGNQTANLKSIEGLTTWVIDEAEELTDEKTFDDISYSVRQEGMDNRIIMVMNPAFKTHFIYQRFIKQSPNNLLHIHTTYKDNEKNLDKDYIKDIESLRESNLHRFEHIFMGKWVDSQEGLLWNKAIIDRNRLKNNPELVRIIVSIDPAVTAKAESDETGIVVQGKDDKGNGYMLEDGSGRYTPNQWASEAKRLADKWQATAYIAEKNQGGDMVESTIRQVDRKRRVVLVTATKGKYLRAEPIFSMYEQNKVFHVGEFPKLEQQMVSFNPESNEKSPDRVDAMVHGFTDLLKQRTEFEVFSV